MYLNLNKKNYDHNKKERTKVESCLETDQNTSS